MATKVILDVDTGTDDAVALMLAALSPDLELIGATTVVGNCPGIVCTQNTLRVFDHIGVDVPVHQGMLEPMVRPDFNRPEKSVIHGLYLDLPPATSKATSNDAVAWLIETYEASAGDITLIPVGPLTNIGMAFRQQPSMLAKLPELVIMGGAHHIGNTTPSAEFNIWVDPEAAKVVMGCQRPIRMVPLDATHKALISLDDCKKLRQLGTPAATAAASFIEQRVEGYNKYQPMAEMDAAPVHDALAVCAVIDPTVIKTELIYVDVETKGELTDGRTVCDFGNRSHKEPNVHFATDVDLPKFKEMMFDILGRTA
ncbi:MAG: nucleoside hydrolase [Anaerolineales bacterium]|nr:nucleoside hydrolase [Anaerolineales bacterium]MCB8936810.1 nucleoside hydrolase [Ardenticatenaceae bacterium]